MAGTALRTLFASICVTGAGTAQSVITVDDDAPADFASITSAVAAAVSGDTIVVRDGIYDAFTVDGIGLNVVADAQANVTVQNVGAAPMTTVRAVPTGASVRIRGLIFDGASLDFRGPQLSVSDCAGEVWIEDCSNAFTVQPAGIGGSANAYRQSMAMVVERSAKVTLINSLFGGLPGRCTFFFPGTQEAGAEALVATDSNLLLHGCTMLGGDTCFQQGAGAAGVIVNGGSAVFRDCTIEGGAGANVSSVSTQPGAGGAGLEVQNGAAAWSIGSELIGGAPPSLFFPAIVGPPSRVVSATLTEFPANAATLTTSDLLVVNSTFGGALATLDLATEADSSTLLIASVGAAPIFVPGLPGFIGPALDQVAIAGGTTGSTGALSTAIPILALPAGVPSLDLALQFAVLTPTGALELSNPSVVSIVDRN